MIVEKAGALVCQGNLDIGVGVMPVSTGDGDDRKNNREP